MNSRSEEPWVGRTLALLGRSAETLDAATLSRLNRARQAALAERRPAWRQSWLIGGGFAGAALALAIGLGIAGHSPRMHVPPGAPVQSGEVDPFVADDGLDLYENLDFYVWFDAGQQVLDD